jgi:hypothetical protein
MMIKKRTCKELGGFSRFSGFDQLRVYIFSLLAVSVTIQKQLFISWLVILFITTIKRRRKKTKDSWLMEYELARELVYRELLAK